MVDEAYLQTSSRLIAFLVRPLLHWLDLETNWLRFL